MKWEFVREILQFPHKCAPSASLACALKVHHDVRWCSALTLHSLCNGHCVAMSNWSYFDLRLVSRCLLVSIQLRWESIQMLIKLMNKPSAFLTFCCTYNVSLFTNGYRRCNKHCHYFYRPDKFVYLLHFIIPLTLTQFR